MGISRTRFSDIAEDFLEDRLDDPFLRPVWEDLTEEDDKPPSILGSLQLPPRQNLPQHTFDPERLFGLLPLICQAQGSLSRLEALAASAPSDCREGFVRRLAFKEAAGWLGCSYSRVNSVDLALRSMRLAGGLGTAAAVKLRDEIEEAGDFDESFAVSQMVDIATSSALLYVRQILHLTRSLAGKSLPGLPVLARGVHRLGGAEIDPGAFQAWLAALPADLPPLLAAANVAILWPSSGLAGRSSALQSTLLSAAILRDGRVLRAAPLPFWSLQPTISVSGSPDMLPVLRGDVAHTAGIQGPADLLSSWLYAVHVGAEAATADLKHLLDVRVEASKWLARADQRDRSLVVYDCCVRQFVVTAASVAKQTGVSQRSAIRILSMLSAEGFVKEVTGRQSYRAFSVR